ncbi:MAG: hypothetical protein AAGI01_15695 [Myxococcota bacterium]
MANPIVTLVRRLVQFPRDLHILHASRQMLERGQAWGRYTLPWGRVGVTERCDMARILSGVPANPPTVELDLERLHALLSTCTVEPVRMPHARSMLRLERERIGDPIDLAMWSWRELLAHGRDARLTIGVVPHGGYVAQTAWVTFIDQWGDLKLFDPMASTPETLVLEPARDPLRRVPEYSIGRDLNTYLHTARYALRLARHAMRTGTPAALPPGATPRQLT